MMFWLRSLKSACECVLVWQRILTTEAFQTKHPCLRPTDVVPMSVAFLRSREREVPEGWCRFERGNCCGGGSMQESAQMWVRGVVSIVWNDHSSAKRQCAVVGSSRGAATHVCFAMGLPSSARLRRDIFMESRRTCEPGDSACVSKSLVCSHTRASLLRRGHPGHRSGSTSSSCCRDLQVRWHTPHLSSQHSCSAYQEVQGCLVP